MMGNDLTPIEARTEIVPAGNSQLSSGMDPKAVEQYAEAVGKIRVACLKTTNKRDWVDLGGEPYLTATGADKVANLFGVCLKHETPVKEWKESTLEDGTKFPYYTYTTRVVGEFKNPMTGQVVTRDDEGSCSSKDALFALRNKYVTDENGKSVKKPYHLPASEVDENNVRKKSITNADNRVLKKMLGMGGLSWDDLKEFGINKEGVTGVSYDKGKKGGQSTTTTAETVDIKNKIQKVVWAYTDGEGDERNKNYFENIKALTAWTNSEGKTFEGKTSLADVSEKAAPVVYGKAKAAYKAKTGEDWAE